jgi:hypothetical protein
MVISPDQRSAKAERQAADDQLCIALLDHALTAAVRSSLMPATEACSFKPRFDPCQKNSPSVRIKATGPVLMALTQHSATSAQIDLSFADPRTLHSVVRSLTAPPRSIFWHPPDRYQFPCRHGWISRGMATSRGVFVDCAQFHSTSLTTDVDASRSGFPGRNVSPL